jgi:hypothetical protein
MTRRENILIVAAAIVAVFVWLWAIAPPFALSRLQQHLSRILR